MGLLKSIMKTVAKITGQAPAPTPLPPTAVPSWSNQVSFRPKTSDINTHIASIRAGRVGIPSSVPATPSLVNLEELQKSRKLG